MAYGLLVALPVLGLAGILRWERHLTAPISVDGAWETQIDAGKLAALPSGRSLAAALETSFTISQSGKNFMLSLAHTPAASSSGVIEGARIRATVSPSAAWASEPRCGDNRLLSLAATVNAQANPRLLEGTLSVNNCPSCSPVRFRAVRISQTRPQAVR
jgi:hypothetical protein